MASRLIVEDNLDALLQGLQNITGKQVWVGVPESRADRSDDAPINNATIGYLMEVGMPEHNVPARPFLVPGVNAAMPDVIPLLEQAYTSALEGKPEKADALLRIAGQTAADRVKDVIQTNIPPPLAPTTIANRYRQRGNKHRRANEKKYLKMISAKGGWYNPAEAQDATGIIALVNTGQLRNSITYVVTNKAGYTGTVVRAADDATEVGGAE